MALGYGLNITKKPKLQPATRRPPAVFGDDNDIDDDPSSAPPAHGGNAARKTVNAQLNSYANLSAKQVEKQSKEVTEVDPSVYDYDAVYDDMKRGERRKKEESQGENQERKPRYMQNLLAMKQVRDRDRLRAEEKLIQREREKEGEEFADKEKFVTSAYKKQQEELRRLEEEEREKEGELQNKSHGISGFYRNMLDREEERFDAVQASVSSGKEGQRRDDTDHLDKKHEKSDLQRASEMQDRTGRNVIVNDEGEVVDKRQLLSGGLNIVKKATSSSGRVPAKADDQHAPRRDYSDRPRSDDTREARARQARQLEAQLQESRKRKEDEQRAKQQELLMKSKKAKTESDVTSARERYLARKRGEL
ncbi:hypothetical protein YB2330_001397 [Saitoella coloradoensis]